MLTDSVTQNARWLMSKRAYASSTAYFLGNPISLVRALESTLSADFTHKIPWTLGSLDSDRILAPKLGPFAIPRELQVISLSSTEQAPRVISN